MTYAKTPFSGPKLTDLYRELGILTYEWAWIWQAERSYPYVDTSGARVPLWLRMEGNLIDPAQLASILPPLCPVRNP